MMQKIIDELKKRGFVDTLQRGINVCSKLGSSGEERQLYASKKTLENYIMNLEEDDKLGDIFAKFAIELAVEAIIKELDLKPQEDYEISKTEEKIFNLTKKLKNMMMEDK